MPPRIPALIAPQLWDTIIPPEEWRHCLRELLREATYLPDPIARSAVHDQIMSRFRRYHHERRPQVEYNTRRQLKIHKDARQTISVLRRANEGYSRPLEKVLRFAYGRNGKRRREMLTTLLASDVPTDSSAVRLLLNHDPSFGDNWNPPPILVDLLKSQNNNPLVTQLNNRTPVRDLEPRIPKTVAWGNGIPLARRKNIRREWYHSVLDVALPPLPDSELKVLEGLLNHSIPWVPPRRRTDVRWRRGSRDVARDVGKGIRTVLVAGPAKEETFRAFTSGRSHTITKRFMMRIWKRISCLVPRVERDRVTGKCQFKWDTITSPDDISVPTNPERTQELFKGYDRGKRKYNPRPKLNIEDVHIPPE